MAFKYVRFFYTLVSAIITNRIIYSFFFIDSFKEFQIPTILAACKADCEVSKREVDKTYGPKLGDLFDIGFVELDTRSDAGIQKIHDVFSMLLRLSIRHRGKYLFLLF